MNKLYNIFILIISCFLVQACANKSLAPVEERAIDGANKDATVSVDGKVIGDTPSDKKHRAKANDLRQTNNNKDFHVVKSGDTLYAIAFRYDSDYKQIATWNKINPPYTIYVGQILRLKPDNQTGKPELAKAKPIPKPNAAKPTPKPVAKPKIPATKPTTKNKDHVFTKGPVSWQWPTKGQLVRSDSPSLKKGINIAGKVGQQIKAAANGKVVYSGSGLLGYGKLIIIKHSETYLSAYAYNSKLLVKEGDIVKLGQNISLMGQDNNSRPILHFEIRKNGKPTNPLDFLPKRRT